MHWLPTSRTLNPPKGSSSWWWIICFWICMKFAQIYAKVSLNLSLTMYSKMSISLLAGTFSLENKTLCPTWLPIDWASVLWCSIIPYLLYTTRDWDRSIHTTVKICGIDISSIPVKKETFLKALIVGLNLTFVEHLHWAVSVCCHGVLKGALDKYNIYLFRSNSTEDLKLPKFSADSAIAFSFFKVFILWTASYPGYGTVLCILLKTTLKNRKYYSYFFKSKSRIECKRVIILNRGPVDFGVPVT